MKHITINHPDGKKSLDLIQERTNQVKEISEPLFDNILKTIQALINKIVEQDSIIQEYEGTIVRQQEVLDEPNDLDKYSKLVNIGVNNTSNGSNINTYKINLNNIVSNKIRES